MMRRIMQNFYVKFLLIFGVLIYCPFALADTDVNVTFFTAPASDISLQFVSALFGRFTTALPQVFRSTSIISTMFTAFNHAVLVLGAITILYTTLIAIVNTAHQGEFLGKKFDSMWVPIRSVAGFALLIPVMQGYSSIQIFMMWVITQGVGAADSLWDAVVPAFDLAGAGHGGETSIQHSDTLQDAMKIEDVWKGIFCMYQQYRTAHGGALPPQPLIPYVFNTDTVSPDRTLQRLFGKSRMNAYDYEKQDAYTYAFIPEENWGDKQNYTCGSLLVPSGTWTDKPTDGINQQIPILMSQMQAVVDSLNTATYDYLKNGVQPGTNPLVDLAYQVEDALSGVSNSSDLTGWKETAETQGWMSAGQFYFDIVASSGAGKKYKTFDQSLKFWSSDTYSQVDHGPPVSDPLLDSFESDADSQLGAGSVAPAASTGNAAGRAFRATGVWAGIVNILAPNFQNLYAEANSNNPIYLVNDPLITIHQTGDDIIAKTMAFWTVSFGVALTAAALSGTFSSVSPGFLIAQVVAAWLLLPLFALFGAVFVFGITMSVYIPLIPFIIFLFAAIGWLFAVVETMLAAPLVALGIAHPEGHEVYGRAEPAVQLLMNVFLRPSFILFGFISGILLMRISLTYLNLLFGGAMSHILSGGGIAQLFKYLMVFAVYITLVIGIVNRCFALTHIIPDQVLRWISNQTQFGSTAPDHAIEAGIKGAASGVSGGGHGGGGHGGGKPAPKGGGGGGGGRPPAPAPAQGEPPVPPAQGEGH
ncbi:MAG: DotA/TraY family protein [Pseudomonadota bacterium]